MVENLTPQLGDYFGAKEGHGVLVRSVEKGSRADKAGFRAGDVIVRVDKDPVHDSSDFSHSLETHRGGGPVSVGIIRDKREQTLTLTIPERRQAGELFGDENFNLPDIDAKVDLEELTTEMARFQPQMEFAIQQAGRALDDVRKSLCRQNQWREEQRKVQKEMRQQNLKMHKQWNQQRREIERELQQLEHSTAI
jgi:membrane-associated protease RseP (regulator of RpoE activity)